MTREGVSDPLEAYDRAVREEDVDHVESGRAERKLGDATRDPFGLEGAGGDDRPDWGSLADRSLPEAEEVEADNEAEHVEPPASAEGPERAVSAAEQEAVKADKELAELMPSLSEAEREIVTQALDRLQHDKDTREVVLREGAACLLAAAIAGS